MGIWATQSTNQNRTKRNIKNNLNVEKKKSGGNTGRKNYWKLFLTDFAFSIRIPRILYLVYPQIFRGPLRILGIHQGYIRFYIRLFLLMLNSKLFSINFDFFFHFFPFWCSVRLFSFVSYFPPVILISILVLILIPILILIHIKRNELNSFQNSF